jgi:hypothetical protein
LGKTFSVCAGLLPSVSICLHLLRCASVCFWVRSLQTNQTLNQKNNPKHKEKNLHEINQVGSSSFFVAKMGLLRLWITKGRKTQNEYP